MEKIKNIIDKYMSERIILVKNPNRKKKTDQYNIRVMKIEDLVELLDKLQLTKKK